MPTVANANSYAVVSLTQPSLSDLNGVKITVIESGKQVIISTTATNNIDTDTSCVIIIEVRNSDGATVYLAYQTVTIEPRSNSTIGVSWLIEERSSHEVRAFVLTDLQNPQVLSAVSSTSLPATPAEGLITKNQAITIVNNYLADKANVTYPELEATFALIKYNDTTTEGDPRFLWLSADPANMRIIREEGSAVFRLSEGKYFSNEIKDRYVWVVVFGGSGECSPTYFVDAAAGEVVGIDGYRGFCEYCWHAYKYKG